MCGRFTLTEKDLARLARRWGAELDAALGDWRPRYNVAPGNPHLLLRAVDGRLRLERAVFGLAGHGPAPALLNARVETAAERRAFRDAWRGRRCAVPADGFFEWGGPAGDRRPTWFHDPAGAPLLFAGLWGDAPGGGLAFAILTTEASADVAALHDRMPVILPAASLSPWLGGAAPPGPAPAGALAARPVSPRVNSVANDDPECLEPPAPERQLKLL
jgi:putative SOS response-associated peptidase YedK